MDKLDPVNNGFWTVSSHHWLDKKRDQEKQTKHVYCCVESGSCDICVGRLEAWRIAFVYNGTGVISISQLQGEMRFNFRLLITVSRC